MLDYASLAALAAVAREGSFERAAAALGVTPSAVSQRVKGLEERVGAILLTRGVPCRPTEIGAKLCAHVEQVRLLESDVVNDLPGLAGPAPGPPTIRVAVNADSVSTWFPAAAALFAADTGAMLDLVLEDEAHTADRLRSGEVIAAVTADPAPVPGCKTYPLGALDYAAVASPAFLARFFPDGVDPAGLAAAPILRFDRRDQLQARWAWEAWNVRIRPPAHWTPSTPGMLDMTLAGLGWAMTPVVLAAPHLAAGRLVELPPRVRIAVTLYWQRTRLTARLLDRLTHAVRSTATGVLTGIATADGAAASDRDG
ncbi:LysR family transcriptional regulator ArgP [Caulobacter sp. Root1472]|uniref:LysR family transcriptional regulator ArgP n=1 Tax=Caulobacter sp. Root1472 TaxID=1736470 RepID=UPI0006F6FA30|nr:LysR family transcriptional regulator ArgP [Caulobacter sp. Root1472]KQZ22054.1 LysR family transcriptional regulator [Caulobacter sp. Root1472]